MYIYVLQLRQYKYYVGKKTNPKFRLSQHFNLNASRWTQKYKPLKVVELIDNCDSYDEDKITLKYMNKYGINNVRGGSFCKIKLLNNEVKIIEQMLKGANDTCYKCGRHDHFVKDCTMVNNDQIITISKKSFLEISIGVLSDIYYSIFPPNK